MNFDEMCKVQARTACTNMICKLELGPADPIPRFTKVQAAILTVELPVSFIGMILSFVFVCRNRPNFLVRVFTYSCIPVTLILAIFWLNNLPVFNETEAWREYCGNICLLSPGLLTVLQWIIAVLSCTISISLLQKLCSTYCDCCSRCRQPSCWRNTRVRVCSEILFVILVVVVPLLIFGAEYGIEFYADIDFEMKFEDFIDILDTITFYNFYIGFVTLVPLALSFISDIVLAVWFCKVRRQIARRGAIYKELVLFGIHLLVTVLTTLQYIFFSWVPSQLTHDGSGIAMMVVLTLLALFPFCVHVYMICSSRTPPRENRPAGNRNLQTAGQQTVPVSTRVSLPSDTAAHAPNFLSPSTAEPTDTTPLLN